VTSEEQIRKEQALRKRMAVLSAKLTKRQKALPRKKKKKA